MASGDPTNPDETKPRRKRGRPPRLSREKIFYAALDLLVEQGRDDFTMAGLAKALDVVPMALYRHVDGLEEVTDGVLGLVLEKLPPPTLTDEPWQAQLSAWMFAFREHMLQYPFAIWFLGSRHHVAPALLAQLDALALILKRAGLEGEGLALAHVWLAQSTVGAMIAEIEPPPTELASRVTSALAAENEYPHYREILNSVTTEEAIYRFHVERTVAALENVAGDPQ